MVFLLHVPAKRTPDVKILCTADAWQSAADNLSFVKFTKQRDYKTFCFSQSIYFIQNTLYRIQYSD